MDVQIILMCFPETFFRCCCCIFYDIDKKSVTIDLMTSLFIRCKVVCLCIFKALFYLFF